MDYIGLLFILIGLGIIAIVIIFYPFFEKHMSNYLSIQKRNSNVLDVKEIMISLDEPSKTSLNETNETNETKESKEKSIIMEMINIPYDFLQRIISYYGKPILHNSIDPFL
jgi:ArsR family metal-binding transcriptional regulator